MIADVVYNVAVYGVIAGASAWAAWYVRGVVKRRHYSELEKDAAAAALDSMTDVKKGTDHGT